VRSISPAIDPDFWRDDGVEKTAQALAAGSLPEVPTTGRRWGAPVSRPSSIICLGHNYHAHVQAAGLETPAAPVMFHKAPTCLSGPNDPVPIPPRGDKVDYEVELGIVIGRRALYLDSVENARACIGGYVAIDDLSDRGFQLEESGGQFSKGKSCPRFCPTGPFLATPDELDLSTTRLRSWVNGEPRQDSLTTDMIFTPAQIVHHLSQYLALEPGDLIATGTPEGVAVSGRFPYLTVGDVVEIEITSLGRQRHEFS
jgi:2-keto-4-pentenoate hydratase/2-oxohepta-3-ene-1,7-dioic acid hydratase in catechol pathway